MLVKVKVFSEPAKQELLQEMTYIIEGFEMVFGGRRAQEIEQDVAEPDPEHEYLILHCADGQTATFRKNYIYFYVGKKN